MLITPTLEKELIQSAAWVLLADGTDESGCDRLALRQITATWGQCDRNKGGVCFAPLADGTDHLKYASVLGYNTGRHASVQELLLWEHHYSFKMTSSQWHTFIRNAARSLLDVRPAQTSGISVHRLTTPRYWYLDKWDGSCRSFVRLCDAKSYAKFQIGVSVAVHSSATGDLVCFADASGYFPP